MIDFRWSEPGKSTSRLLEKPRASSGEVLGITNGPLAGAGFSLWLTYVEVFTLEAICIWCVASAVCMVALAALSTVRMLQPVW